MKLTCSLKQFGSEPYFHLQGDNPFSLGILNKRTKIRKNNMQEDHQEFRMPKQEKYI